MTPSPEKTKVSTIVDKEQIVEEVKTSTYEGKYIYHYYNYF